MRVAVVGATGNIGTSVLGALSADSDVEEIVGIARREGGMPLPKVRWHAADIVHDDLAPAFEGVDAVIHLAWKIQPSHDRQELYATNVTGSRRVFQAAVDAGVKTVVYSSSVGAYSPGPKKQVDESHPTDGIPGSAYSEDKAATEGMIDTFEREHPNIRWVRIRPALAFKREAASSIRRIFLGNHAPTQLLSEPKLPVFPNIPGLAVQAVHTADLADAYVLALKKDVRGAFNIAAEPILTPEVLAETLHARLVPMPVKVARGAVNAAWRAHAYPLDPGWVDIALQTPLLDVSRAYKELGWHPKVKSTDALIELFDGMIKGDGFGTPPLHKMSSWILDFRDDVAAKLRERKEQKV